MIDDADWERVSSYPHPWRAQKFRRRWYAVAHWKDEVGWHSVFLHRWLLGETDPKVIIDHRDHNGLNCQRSNLRRATFSQNAANAERAIRAEKPLRSKYSSQYRGVYWNGYNWAAHIRINRKRHALGTFALEDDAARAYDQAAKRFFGEFANPNFKE